MHSIEIMMGVDLLKIEQLLILMIIVYFHTMENVCQNPRILQQNHTTEFEKNTL